MRFLTYFLFSETKEMQPLLPAMDQSRPRELTHRLYDGAGMACRSVCGLVLTGAQRARGRPYEGASGKPRRQMLTSSTCRRTDKLITGRTFLGGAVVANIPEQANTS